ncbi:uncharacterized protein DUF4388 [Thermosporothrix hazakensis]|uniref:Uncharacterized protein DUF4388 n=1 Tax=Thermosporothrix hazakensis TaxID=644383 RepID=A0A326UA82_THEHA|nr:DUF4388 domain-containing protein [Thermosporothrix hazakensis]PZW32991.1 uncharacterized protein DUF4388 [Thermosporothrix hazakensis]GCE49023.1 hypothetical protein KTH_38920 [Thermosporothrix hazakensis]
MSFIGTLEQFPLSQILQRLEAYAKTGLLVVKRGGQWIEFYCRDGRLICIGPLRTNATLGERLVQEGVISMQAAQDVQFALGADAQSETRTALALIDRGHVRQDDLRTWAYQNALKVLQVLVRWNSGELYFEENAAPPPERLLVALTISTLLSAAFSAQSAPLPSSQSYPASPASQQGIPPTQMSPLQPQQMSPMAAMQTQMSPVQPPQMSPVQQYPQMSPVQQQKPVQAPAAPAEVPVQPGTVSASQLLFDAIPASNSLPATESISPVFNNNYNNSMHSVDTPSLAGINAPKSSPYFEPVHNPVVPQRIDTSFMRPDMVLIPADLSALRDQNPQYQLTPEQWRVLTRVDGNTTLQTACQELAMLPDQLCLVAGELVAMGLIHVAPASAANTNELSPAADLRNPLLNSGYVAPGSAATTVSPWTPAPVSEPATTPFSSAFPFETESQWGNGGNGATFVPGRGWVTRPQSAQPSGPIALQSGLYANHQ